MYVKNIKLENYRNYPSLCNGEGLDFGRNVTLLIGKNGAGKTNLISALKQSLSFIFSKNSKIVHRNFISDSIQSIKSFETTDATRIVDENGRQSQIASWPISIETSIDIDEDSPLEVIFKREGLSSGMKEAYSSSSIRYWSRYRNLKDLPVLAFYSDSFPHEKVTVGKKIQELLDSKFGIQQPAGYYNWDDPRDCSNVWQQFFIQQWKNFKYGNRNNNEEEYLAEIVKCLKCFSEPLENAEENKDFELSDVAVVARGGNKEVVVLRFKNGAESDFDTLPAGYKRAYSIAFDLASRAFLLNKNCNPDGIALIDEIDLHLHPSLAQEILERIQRTFPRIQFIVSTHSPMVLSNFKQNGDDCVVYSLSRNVDFSTRIQKIDYSYGIDYSSLLTNLMGTKIRNTMLRKMVDNYIYWRTAKENDLASKELDNIRNLVGADSELVKKLEKR